VRIPAVAGISSCLLLLALAGPAGAARNGRIYFTAASRGEATGCGIASASAKGSGFSCVDYFRRDPAISPDHKRLAAVDGSGPTEVYVMKLNGKGVKRLTHAGSGAIQNFSPVFSRDSRQIMWSRYGSSNDGIFLMNPDGSGERQLLNQGQDPVFSPSGSQIAYGGDGIGIVNADGSGARTVLANRNEHGFSGGVSTAYAETNREPNWSPDGRQIVFARETHARSLNCTSGCQEQHTAATDVYLMNADGSGVRQLTSNAAFEEEDPQFSPDGKSIVYYRLRTGRDDTEGQIWVMKADGRGKHQVARGANPEWSTVQGGPKKPRLKFSYLRLKKHAKCLGKFDGYSFRVRTKASRKTDFDVSTYVDGKLLRQEFNTRGFGDGVDFLRKGRHKVKVVVVDAAVHDRISRTFKFRRC
jgi:Tol biopolymer transport system component